jgi:pyruvate ferredoxin oxidoreductase beta subunit
MHVAFENASAVGSGVAAALKVQLRKGGYSDKDTKVVVIGGEGGTSDIGFQSLSGALERNHDFVYICFDNEAYMNTGVQRSSATPAGAWTTTSPTGNEIEGKRNPKKDLIAIVADHSVPYVATATPAHYPDLMNKVRRAAHTPGAAFIHVFSPCPTGWRMPSDQTIEICKLAVKTNIYPLYEVIDGRYVMKSSKRKPHSIDKYLSAQGRFRHLSGEQVEMVQRDVNMRYQKLVKLASI